MTRRLGAARRSRSHACAKKSERKNSAAPETALTRMPYCRQARMAARTPLKRRCPNSSAARYMAVTRTPAVPASMAKTPMVEMSCISPSPAAPMRTERKT